MKVYKYNRQKSTCMIDKTDEGCINKTESDSFRHQFDSHTHKNKDRSAKMDMKEHKTTGRRVSAVELPDPWVSEWTSPRPASGSEPGRRTRGPAGPAGGAWWPTPSLRRSPWSLPPPRRTRWDLGWTANTLPSITSVEKQKEVKKIQLSLWYDQGFLNSPEWTDLLKRNKTLSKLNYLNILWMIFFF